MTKSGISVVAGFLMMGSSSLALAQVTNTVTGIGGAAPASPAQVDIELTGEVESSVSLTIDGTRLSNENNALGTAEVDFGTFSTNSLTTANADTANRTPLLAAVPGAFVAVNLTANLSYSGVATGTMSVERAANFQAVNADDIPVGNLLFGTAAQTWADPAVDGDVIDEPGVAAIDVCASTAGICTNATNYAHQLAVFIPDSQAAGSFTSVVRYTGTAP